MIRVLLSVPKRVGRRTLWVKAVITDDWGRSPDCKDLDTATRLAALRPEWLQSYLPPPTIEWAQAAEKLLSARLMRIEELSDSPDPEGIVY